MFLIGLEPLTQAPVGARKLRFGKAGGATKCACDLLVRIALDLKEPHDGPCRRREARQGPFHIQPIAGYSRRIGERHDLLIQPRIQLEASTMPRRAQVHEASRNCNLAHPRTQGGLPAKRVEPLEYRDQGVLEDILGHGTRSEDAANQPEGCRRNLAIEAALRRFIPAARTLDELMRYTDVGKPAHTT